MTPTAIRTPIRSRGTSIGTPELSEDEALLVITHLDERLVSLIDLALTLKHVHWNVTGPSFLAVHEMFDAQVEAVRPMVDALAERIAALGGTPIGTPRSVAERRSWSDYSVLKADTTTHLVEIEKVYSGIIGSHHAARSALSGLDPVSEDMLIQQLNELEQFRLLVQAQLEGSR